MLRAFNSVRNIVQLATFPCEIIKEEDITLKYIEETVQFTKLSAKNFKKAFQFIKRQGNKDKSFQN